MSTDPDTVNVRLLGGELLHELGRGRRGDDALSGLGSQAEDVLVDLVVRLLARHFGETLADDEDFPVQPLPRPLDPGADSDAALPDTDWEENPLVAITDPESVRLLVDCWEVHTASAVPSTDADTGISDDILAYLIPEDTELRGQVRSCLRLYHPVFNAEQKEYNWRRLQELRTSDRPMVSTLPDTEICLSSTIDVSLREAAPAGYGGEKGLALWREYRWGMVRLARALSIVTGIPIVDCPWE